MLAIDVHCRVGGPTSLLPTAQGNDVECCHVNVAVHFLDILISSLKQKWQDIPGLSAIQSWNLPDIGYTLCLFLYRLLGVECFTVHVNITPYCSSPKYFVYIFGNL